jgi:hypothetical protein
MDYWINGFLTIQHSINPIGLSSTNDRESLLDVYAVMHNRH